MASALTPWESGSLDRVGLGQAFLEMLSGAVAENTLDDSTGRWSYTVGLQCWSLIRCPRCDEPCDSSSTGCPMLLGEEPGGVVCRGVALELLALL